MIDTRRLTLRPLTPDDCTSVYLGWLKDPVVNRYLETRHTAQSMAAIRSFVTKIADSPNEILFGIFRRSDAVHIGNIKVGPVKPIHLTADVSLFIGDRSAWGMGFATEAIVAVSRFAFDLMDVRKLSASMYAPNVGSTRAFLAAGYVEEGRRRAHYDLEGARCDLIELGLLPEDAS